jgi:hypothetical protein
LGSFNGGMGIMNLLIAPHPDDETLFGAYTIMKEKPLVAIYRFQNRIDRIEESKEAMQLLGANVQFINFINELTGDFDKVYAPALQGGHPFHDYVCRKAIEVYGNKVVFYSTYEIGNLHPYGRFKVEATDEMKELKLRALQCYKSQLIEYPWHFTLIDKSEYLF